MPPSLSAPPFHLIHDEEAIAALQDRPSWAALWRRLVTDPPADPTPDPEQEQSEGGESDERNAA